MTAKSDNTAEESRATVVVPVGSSAVATEVITDAFMRNLGTVSGNAFEDAMALAAQVIGEDVKSFAEEMGNGFSILPSDEKYRLVGTKCLFLKWRFTDGDYGRFVNVAVLTPDGQKLIVNDGSAGICGQLWEYTQDTGRDNYRLAERGLRESSYPTCHNCGKPRDTRDDECRVCHDTDTRRGVGTTYYIDLAG